MCVDFRDLNKACPKDDYPLTHLHVLVDNTAGNALMSFMESFSGYNQIKMAARDMTKTTFITEWGIYCYTVMPFEHKNASVTYQRMATALLHDMMHNEVEMHNGEFWNLNYLLLENKQIGLLVPNLNTCWVFRSFP